MCYAILFCMRFEIKGWYRFFFYFAVLVDINDVFFLGLFSLNVFMFGKFF